MKIAHEPTPHDVFLNVRKSYRLLHDYQCMVLGAVHYIGAQLDIGYNSAWPGFDRVAGFNPTKLNMVFYESHFLKDLGDAGKLSLSFFIISDTGFFEGDDKVNDKENLSAYAPANQSSSKFAFILRKTHWDPFPFMEDKFQMRNFIKEGGSLPDYLIKANCVGKCYDMSCLASESEADKVVRDLIIFAKEKSWPLELKKKLHGAILARSSLA